MDDLHKQAEELGIQVDNRWSEETLRQKIDEALGDNKPAKEAKEPKEAKAKEPKTFPIVLLKNYRPIGKFKVSEDGEHREPNDEEVSKVRAGTTILIGLDEAKAVIAKKIGERADELG